MKKNLTFKELAVLGCALFSMHFGASCMLYPLTWGKESGSAVYVVYITIVLSALLLPLLAYVALSKGKGDFLKLTTDILPRLGKTICNITIFVMGPLYVIPRMSSAAWAAIVQLFGIDSGNLLLTILFNVSYYAITFWFLNKRDDTADKIGKLLFPVLAVVVVGVIGKGILDPVSTTMAEPSFTGSPLVYGFLQGYATGDLPAALMFGMVIYQGVKAKGVDKNHINANIIKVGFVGLGLLALTHLGHMIVGAYTGGTIDLTLSALYTEVILQLWGRTGGILFGIALYFAALTSAIGLSGSTAEYFEGAIKSGNKNPQGFAQKCTYKNLALVTVALSAFFSSFGLDNVIAYIGPLLDACYPTTIIMVLYYVLVPNVTDKRMINGARCAMVSTLAVCLMDVYGAYDKLLNINFSGFYKFYNLIPLSDIKLAWVYIAAIFFVIGLLCYKPNKTAK